MLKTFTAYEKQHQWGFSIAYQLITCFTLTIIGCMSKLMKRIPACQQLIYRNSFQLVFTYQLRSFVTDSHYIQDPDVRWKVYARAVLGAVNAILYYYGIQMISLSEAVILTRTAPLWTSLIMIFILKRQNFSLVLLMEILVCFAGIILVAKPPFFLEYLGKDVQEIDEFQHLLGATLILIQAVQFSVSQIILKGIGNSLNSLIVVDYLSFTIIIISTGVWITSENFVTLSIYDLFLFVITAILGIITQYTLTKAFGIGNVTQLSLLGQIQVVFSMIVDNFVLDSKIDVYGYIGTFIILSCLIINTIRKTS